MNQTHVRVVAQRGMRMVPELPVPIYGQGGDVRETVMPRRAGEVQAVKKELATVESRIELKLKEDTAAVNSAIKRGDTKAAEAAAREAEQLGAALEQVPRPTAPRCPGGIRRLA